MCLSNATSFFRRPTSRGPLSPSYITHGWAESSDRFLSDIEGKSKSLRLLAGCHLYRSCGGTILLGQEFGRSPLSTAFAELKSGFSDDFSRVTSAR